MQPFGPPPESERSIISREEIDHYKREFSLSGQLDLLLEMDRWSSLRGKTVLEIGGSNIPGPFIFEVLKARRWVSVDRVYPQNRVLWPLQYSEVEVIPIAAQVEFDTLSDFVVLDGGIELLPPSFAERFDAIVSIDAFEHVHKFSTMLDQAYGALKPNGQLNAIYSPIWPSHFGHHLWGVTDKSGRTFYIETSPIPSWGHLLMRPHELYRYLLDHTDPETADEIVRQVHHGDNLNRLFVEDYEAYFRNSRFPSYSIRSFVPNVEPPPDIQKELERLHPGRKQFSMIGIHVRCDKSIGA